jgi:hypothetical protein
MGYLQAPSNGLRKEEVSKEDEWRIEERRKEKSLLHMLKI